jgi:hypothetical protein
MKLTETVIKIIGEKKDRKAKAIRHTLALALNFTSYWVEACIRQNKDNGPLTTIKAIQIIEKATGFKQSQILEEVPENARV